jgi:type VI secretion system protein ImpF
MAEFSARDALQPALLDRLIDDAPSQRVESRDERIITRSKLRACVLRDLAWLFNTTAPASDVEVGDETVPMSSWPHVRETVLNYGLPALSGKLLSGLDLSRLEQAMREAILAFEPRILAHSLEVHGFPPQDRANHHNVLTFEIRGQLWAQPYPLELLIKTDVNLESGEVRMVESN